MAGMLRRFLILLSVLSVSCTLQSPQPADSITIALGLPPTNLDPRIGIDATSLRLSHIIFSSLVKTNDVWAIEPDLALSWDVPDPTTYIFHLRENVRFHDGRPLSARDVVYTFRSMLDGSIKTSNAGTYRRIESIDAPDPKTVVFKLKEASPHFLWDLTMGIIPEGSPATFGLQPIGSGAFQFVHYLQDAEVLLKRNEDYYGEKPSLSTVRFKVIPEAIVRALELRKRTVDTALNALTPDMVEVLRKDSDLNVMTGEGTNYQYIALNVMDPVFSDVRVRKAIAYAIDREQIVKYLLRDQARLATGVIPPNNWAYEPNVATYSYNPQRARELLKEAGRENLSFTFSVSTDDTNRMIASVLQQQLKEVGIRMEIRSNEFATFFADVVSGNFQAYTLQWVGGNNDPDSHLNLIFHSKMTPPNGSNRGRYANEEVDRLIDSARQEMDQEKRKKAYQRVQQIVADELPYISLFYVDNVCVYNKRIAGMTLNPAGGYEFLTNVRTMAKNSESLQGSLPEP
jgi:peptide/nickel transport system substrate-binding protein